PALGAMQYPQTAPLAARQVAFTFDDGPNPDTTPLILDILDRHCVKATFFIIGIYAERHPEIVRDIAARGHTIGTHTWSHPNNLRHLPLANA
ncbi:polysaccharide deacetylase family protein, partial [Ligilactobacillus salivarius]|uniref:polysaccharide deacetylase family protein n=1 Tax=Ligilactobacillus salivarius TaxID=1624 RepID=UPI003C10B518